MVLDHRRLSHRATSRFTGGERGSRRGSGSAKVAAFIAGAPTPSAWKGRRRAAAALLPLVVRHGAIISYTLVYFWQLLNPCTVSEARGIGHGHVPRVRCPTPPPKAMLFVLKDLLCCRIAKRNRKAKRGTACGTSAKSRQPRSIPFSTSKKHY